MTTENLNAPATPTSPEITTTAPTVVVPEVKEPAVDTTAALSAPTVQSFDATGDAGLDLALEFIGKLGIGPDDDAIDAAQNGDFTKITERLKGMGDRATGFEKYLALAKASYEKNTATVKEQAAKLEALVHDAAGGKENWAKVKAWASANATDAERNEINRAFEAGGFAAKAAAERLATLYAKSGAAGHKSAAKPNAGAAESAGTGALTAKQYQAEVMALQAKGKGRDVSGTAEYQALQARRLAGRRSGI